MAECRRIRLWRGVVCAFVGGTVLTGCEGRLRAPPLEDGPVYRNTREGFRFFVPDGWKQRARGEVPAGKIETERMLAEYRCLTCDGTLMVSVVDIPVSMSLAEYVAKNTKTAEDWHQQGPPEEFAINGMPAVRLSYVEGEGRRQMIREVVAFRRDERVYFFKSYFASHDAQSRKALRDAVDTIVW
jgi:hypothetical protein